MEVPRADCPKCGSNDVKGQLVPTKDFAAGFLTVLLTDDAAAGILAQNDGKLVAQAFCLACGAIWLPAQEYLIRSIQGVYGPAAQEQARAELEAMIAKTKGFRLVSGPESKAGEWAEAVLRAANAR